MCTGAGWPSLGAFYPLNHIRPPLVKQNPHFRHYFTSAPYRAQSAAGLWTERESAPSRREAKDRAACGKLSIFPLDNKYFLLYNKYGMREGSPSPPSSGKTPFLQGGGRASFSVGKEKPPPREKRGGGMCEPWLRGLIPRRFPPRGRFRARSGCRFRSSPWPCSLRWRR